MIVEKGTLFTAVQQQWKSKCDDQRYPGTEFNGDQS